MGTVAQNADIYNFLESRLFSRTIYYFAFMRKEGIYTLLETLPILSFGLNICSPTPQNGQKEKRVTFVTLSVSVVPLGLEPRTP